MTEEKADRYNENKPDLGLLAPNAILHLGAVYSYGAKKYAPDNWRKGLTYRACLASGLRHVFAFLAGENYDKESGLHHLAHAAWNCLTVLEYELLGTYERFDDRPAVRPYEEDELQTILRGIRP